MRDTLPTASHRRLLFLGVAVLALACDRGVEPFDPDEEPSPPDLARIFPETGESRSGGPGGSSEAPPRAAASQRGNKEGAALASAPPIRGVVELDPALAGATARGSVLFVIARTQPAGPPLAVLRVPDPSFPYQFEIGQGDVMIPSLQFAGEIKLSARLDSDGNAMTKLPGDLEGAHPTAIPPGTSGITFTLKSKL